MSVSLWLKTRHVAQHVVPNCLSYLDIGADFIEPRNSSTAMTERQGT
jgi:hypothetical protein